MIFTAETQRAQRGDALTPTLSQRERGREGVCFQARGMVCAVMLLCVCGNVYGQMDVWDSHVASATEQLGGGTTQDIWEESSFPYELIWDKNVTIGGSYIDLDEVPLSTVGAYDWYFAQPGAMVYDANAGTEPGYLTIHLYHRWAYDLEALAESSWSEIGANPDPYDGGADPEYYEYDQMTLQYLSSIWAHRVLEWKIEASNSYTSEIDSATTIRVWFGATATPTPTPTYIPTTTGTPVPLYTPTPTPVTPTPTSPPPTSTPTPSSLVAGWYVFRDGHWYLVRAN